MKRSFKNAVTTVFVGIGTFSLIGGFISLEFVLFKLAAVCFAITGASVLVLILFYAIFLTKKSVKLNGHKIKAVIFDMDGTLIDSTVLWHEIDKQFFSKRGLELPSDYAQKIVHLGLKQAAKYTKETYHLKESEQEIMDEWHQMSIDMYTNDVQLKENALELIQFFYEKNIIMSIATANDEELYLPCLKRLDILKYIDFVADVNSVQEGKQSAKIYEYLAGKMKAKKESVLVVEDMPTCIKTAHDNCFITVAMYDNASKDYDEDKKKNSDLFVNNLGELIDALKNTH